MKKILLSVIFLVACSSLTQKYQAKPELIEAYSNTLQSSEPFKAPSVAKFNDSKKELWFVGIQHSDDEQSASFKTIQKAFDDLKPSVVLIEGVEDTGILSPSKHSEYVKRMAAHHFKGGSESTFTAWLAISHGIPYAPTEPSDLSIASDFERKGQTRKDYAFFEVARMLPQWKMQKKVKNWNDYETEAKVYGSRALPEAGVSGTFDFEEFKKWFREKMGHDLSYTNFSNEDTSPQMDEDPTEMNRLSHLCDESREVHIHGAMVKMLNQYDRVLVVFGSGHLAKHRKVLTSLLGEPQNEKWFPEPANPVRLKDR